MNNSIINRASDNIRALSAAMVEKAKSGHPGGAMGGADFINILYSEFLNFDPDDMAWPHRDRFFLCHQCYILYLHYLTFTVSMTLKISVNGEALPPDTLNGISTVVLKTHPDLSDRVMQWQLVLP
jgi:hypothetical protein